MDALRTILSANSRFVIVLFLFIVLDVLTGITKALIENSLKSSVMRNGLLKKVMELILVVVAFACDWAFDLALIGKGALTALIAMEAWSILENIESYVPLPSVLKAFIIKMKEEGSND